MPDRVLPGPVQEGSCIREAVCIHTRKIYDSCKDKDCIEDLRFYPTRQSQCYIDNAISVRAKSAKLLHVAIDVEEVTFNRGYYTIDIRYFYRVKGEACTTITGRPEAISGLCVFDKRVMLYGSEGNAKVFTSDTSLKAHDASTLQASNLPTAVVEAVDPIVLSMKLIDVCENVCDCGVMEIPPSISNAFQCELIFDNSSRRIFVTLGQFSIIRLERDTQLLIPTYDYCLPDKECIGSNEDDPCSLFARIKFPVDEFFPPDTMECPDGYREAKNAE